MDFITPLLFLSFRESRGQQTTTKVPFSPIQKPLQGHYLLVTDLFSGELITSVITSVAVSFQYYYIRNSMFSASHLSFNTHNNLV